MTGRGRLLVAAGAIAPLGLFGLLLVLVRTRWGALASLDQRTATGLHRIALRHDGYVLGLKVVSTLGTSRVYEVVFALLLVWLLWRGRRRAALFVVVTTISGSILNARVKDAVDRPRPVFAQAVSHAGHSSFPSGHAQGVVVACGVLFVVALPFLAPVARRRLAAAATAWVLLMGFSRVALGVHYVSDVLAGYCLGGAWLLLCCCAFGLPGLAAPPQEIHSNGCTGGTAAARTLGAGPPPGAPP